MKAMPATISPQPTPNPNAMKFVVEGQTLAAAGSRTFADATSAAADPLAAALFAIDGVAQVFFLKDFVTVTKTPEAAWPELGPAVEAALTAHFA